MPESPINWNERYATKDAPWDSGEPSRELIRVIDQYPVKPCRMIELGCGTGTNAVYLAQRGFDVTAFDLAPLAIEQAQAKAKKTAVSVKFLVADALNPPEGEFNRPFDFVFDRGVYHSIRPFNLWGFLRLLEGVTRPGSLYLTLTGNANDPDPNADKGPPRVSAHDVCKELQPLFDVVQLREFHFDGVVAEGQPMNPLGWSALMRRR